MQEDVLWLRDDRITLMDLYAMTLVQVWEPSIGSCNDRQRNESEMLWKWNNISGRCWHVLQMAASDLRSGLSVCCRFSHRSLRRQSARICDGAGVM
jgi:hypothetical protein